MRTRTTVLPFCLPALLIAGLVNSVGADSQVVAEAGSAAEPIRIVGTAEPDFQAHDGALPPVVGTHNIQVMRANRTHPNAKGADGLGWTYSHAPMLCYWNGKFYLEYLSNPVGEHIAPGQTLLSESKDGMNWSRPRVAFPPFKASGDEDVTVAHQRMGFYIAPNGRLLVVSFYGRVPRPNDGKGVGRAVREINKDGTFGPIHFVRYNKHAGFDEANTPYPFYKTSEDEGFVIACDALLSDKLMTQQWWEEDRSEDGFYALSGNDNGFEPKALSFYHRPDGTVVGLWKKRWAALSLDEGQSWTEPVRLPSLVTGGAKTWGQATEDGRYAMAFNPHPAHRWPLVMVTGEDGITYGEMLTAHGEIPYPRFDGQYKSMGPQYVRGIAEGNGNPPGNDMWLTYSVNKEDIWVTKLPLPIRSTVDEPVDDDFDDQKAGLPVSYWNVYSPLWSPVAIAPTPGTEGGHSLRLEDGDPYDYAKAVRVFPASKKVVARFRVRPEMFKGGQLDIELLDRHGRRPVQLVINQDGLHRRRKLESDFDRLQVQPTPEKQWVTLELRADTDDQTFAVLVDGELVLARGAFAEETSLPLERLCFRTGPFRNYDAHAADLLIDDSKLGDRLDGDEQVPTALFYVDDVLIQ